MLLLVDAAADAFDRREDFLCAALLLLELDDPDLEQKDALLVMEHLSGLDPELRSCCVLYTHGAREASALLSLLFPKVIAAPGAMLSGLDPTSGWTPFSADAMQHVEACEPERAFLARALLQGLLLDHDRENGWHHATGYPQSIASPILLDDLSLLESGLYAGSASRFAQIPPLLGIDPARGHRLVSRRTSRNVVTMSHEEKARVQILRSIKKFNQNLVKAHEGINIVLSFHGELLEVWSPGDPDRRTRVSDPALLRRGNAMARSSLKIMRESLAVFEKYERQGIGNAHVRAALDLEEDVLAVRTLYDALTDDHNPIELKEKAFPVLALDPIPTD